MDMCREQERGQRIPMGSNARLEIDLNVPTYVKGHVVMNKPIESNNQRGSSLGYLTWNQCRPLSSALPARTGEDRRVVVQAPMRVSSQPRRHQHPGTVAGRVQTWCAKQVLQAFYMGNNVTII